MQHSVQWQPRLRTPSVPLRYNVLIKQPLQHQSRLITHRNAATPPLPSTVMAASSNNSSIQQQLLLLLQQQWLRPSENMLSLDNWQYAGHGIQTDKQLSNSSNSSRGHYACCCSWWRESDVMTPGTKQVDATLHSSSPLLQAIRNYTTLVLQWRIHDFRGDVGVRAVIEVSQLLDSDWNCPKEKKCQR